MEQVRSETDAHIFGNLAYSQGAFRIRDEKTLLTQLVICIDRHKMTFFCCTEISSNLIKESLVI